MAKTLLKGHGNLKNNSPCLPNLIFHSWGYLMVTSSAIPEKKSKRGEKSVLLIAGVLNLIVTLFHNKPLFPCQSLVSRHDMKKAFYAKLHSTIQSFFLIEKKLKGKS